MFNISSKTTKGLLFIARLIGAYLFLFILYDNLYLSFYSDVIDPYTYLLSLNVDRTLESIGYKFTLYTYTEPHCLSFWWENKPIFGIIEGCNGISISMLFIAFIIAFKGPILLMIKHLIFGTTIIAVLNFLRIIVLGILFVEYPRVSAWCHDVIFPLGMYGIVLLLWVYWIKIAHGQKA